MAETQPSQTPSAKADRDDILDAIRGIKVKPGQALRQVEVPQNVYNMARQFATWAPNVARGGARYRFKMDFIYQLLVDNIKARTSLETSKMEIEGWQTACKALLRYALNLLLAPKRPEFRRMKVCFMCMYMYVCMYVCT